MKTRRVLQALNSYYDKFLLESRISRTNILHRAFFDSSRFGGMHTTQKFFSDSVQLFASKCSLHKLVRLSTKQLRTGRAQILTSLLDPSTVRCLTKNCVKCSEKDVYELALAQCKKLLMLFK